MGLIAGCDAVKIYFCNWVDTPYGVDVHPRHHSHSRLLTSSFFRSKLMHRLPKHPTSRPISNWRVFALRDPFYNQAATLRGNATQSRCGVAYRFRSYTEATRPEAQGASSTNFFTRINTILCTRSSGGKLKTFISLSCK